MKLRLAYYVFFAVFFLLSINLSKAQVTSGQIDTNVVATPNGAGGLDYNVNNNHSPQEYINGTSGRKYIINRYTQFSLNSNDVANVYIKSADASLNIVNGPASNIQGVINSLYGTSAAPGGVGGEFIFINPAGIFVSASGAINAGSIILSTSNTSDIPLGPGVDSYADLNDSAQDGRLFLQGINDSGIAEFSGVTQGISMLGSVNATTTRGVFMYGRFITIDGTITVPEGGAVKLFTGDDFNLGLGSGVGSTSSALTTSGAVNVNGTINAPSGMVEIVSNTSDINFNIINVMGLINATAISSNGNGGSVILRTQQPANGQVVLDGAGPGSGAIVADAMGTGTGGNVTVSTADFNIVNGGYIWARNTDSGPNGGTVNLYANLLTAPTELGPTGFVDPASIAAISTATTVYPSSVGNLYIYDDPETPGLLVNGNYTFPTATDVFLGCHGGNINQTAGSSLVANKSLSLCGNDVNINGLLNSHDGNVKLMTKTGKIVVGSSAVIESGPSSFVGFQRDGTNGPLDVYVDGRIISGAGSSPFYIGNSDSNMFTRDSITLSGSSFNSLAGVYYYDADLTPTNSNLNVSMVSLRLNSPPVPPTPTSPPSTSTGSENDGISEEEKNQIITDAESANSDLVNYETHVAVQVEEPNFEPDGAFDDTGIGAILASLNDDGKADDSDIELLLTLCFKKRCSPTEEENLGAFVVNTLLKGYPYENEFTADSAGLVSSYEAGYSPKGLQGFLETVQYLENMETVLSGGSETGTSNLFGYKHPPSDERIEKVKNEIELNQFLPQNKIVNKKAYKRIIKFIEW